MRIPKSVSILILLCFLLSAASSQAFITHIKFDHKKDDDNNGDGLAIRENFTKPQKHKPDGVGEGEYIRFNSGTGAGEVKRRSEAALFVANKKVTVKVRITNHGQDYNKADFWATPPMGFDPKSKMPTLKKRTVHFMGGVSRGDDGTEYVVFEIDENGTGFFDTKINRIEGKWEWRIEKRTTPAGAVLPGSFKFGESGEIGDVGESDHVKAHKVFVVLDKPKLPWYNGNSECHPWVEALEHVIVPAQLQNANLDDGTKAVSFVTNFLFHFGYIYDTKDGIPFYHNMEGERNFNLTGFMKLSQEKVNCTDMALGNFLLTRLLGIDVVLQSHKEMGYLNQNRLVGVGEMNNPFPDKRKSGELFEDEDATEPIRQPFGLHRYNIFKGEVYDSTLGPQLGGINDEMYFNKIVDTTTGPERRYAGIPGHSIAIEPSKVEFK